MKTLAYLSIQDLIKKCSCTQDALDGEESSCEACQVRGAIEAGIPRSVVAGETKLTDHFSQEYIDSQCGLSVMRGDLRLVTLVTKYRRYWSDKAGES